MGNYLFWKQADKTKVKRINQLIRDIQRDPFDGIGKPEALRHGLTGLWSRRIDDDCMGAGGRAMQEQLPRTSADLFSERQKNHHCPMPLSLW
ncbi:Txe/YoeB family addiction module toxin [Methylobacter sp.]|uniref:Txe/YoeB family addiction module toxin n=1 Tax=Methylobacter sp. TaxID=2051955 RepID=UPI003520C837